MAARLSGRRTIAAIIIPTITFGASTFSTQSSMVGLSSLAKLTTINSERNNRTPFIIKLLLGFIEGILVFIFFGDNKKYSR